MEDLEEVDEWLTSPVAAPAPAAVPTGTRQRRIRQASMADPFVEAEAGEAEMGDDSAGADDAEMQQDESTASPAEAMELPEPPDAGESVGAAVSPAPLKSAVSPAGGQAVEVAEAEAESEPTRDASIFFPSVGNELGDSGCGHGRDSDVAAGSRTSQSWYGWNSRHSCLRIISLFRKTPPSRFFRANLQCGIQSTDAAGLCVG